MKKDTLPVEYIQFIHERCLSKIYEERGFEGLSYFGGPQIKCEYCNKMVVLPCVKSGIDSDPNPTPSCPSCDFDCAVDVNDFLVSTC